MPLETAPASSQSDGRYRITYVPTGSNAKSVAILNGATAKPLTYGITADGWNHTKTQAEVVDGRLTMIQDLSRPGKVKEALEITCVASTTADSADVILSGLATSGANAQLVVRRAIDNATTHVVAQVADVLTVVVGVRRPNPPVENGVDTVTFTCYFVSATENQVALVA
jgi:hypothetical protein